MLSGLFYLYPIFLLFTRYLLLYRILRRSKIHTPKARHYCQFIIRTYFWHSANHPCLSFSFHYTFPYHCNSSLESSHHACCPALVYLFPTNHSAECKFHSINFLPAAHWSSLHHLYDPNKHYHRHSRAHVSYPTRLHGYGTHFRFTTRRHIVSARLTPAD